MKPTVSDELMDAIAELRTLFPDWRLGQLLANLTIAAGQTNPEAIWDVEDAALLSAARRLIERNQARQAASA